MPLKAKLKGDIKFSWMFNDDEWNKLMVEHNIGTCPIKMCCCDSDGHMRRSVLGTKHFYHASTPKENCNYKSEESQEHLLLKELIAKNIHLLTPKVSTVETEYDGLNWKADVYCEVGLIPIIFEVQLSKINIADLIIRDSKYQELGFESYWLIPKNIIIKGILTSNNINILRFSIDENAQLLNNRYIFTNTTSQYLPNVIEDIFNNRICGKKKSIFTSIRQETVDNHIYGNIREESKCCKMVPHEPNITRMKGYYTPFEKECESQSNWESDQGMWKYIKLPNGLIIPTYNPK